MGKVAFIRLAEVINRKQDMRVVSVTVKPTITDCSGTIYFTDLQLQEGAALTGYTPHTEVFLQKFRENGEVKAPSGSTAWCGARKRSSSLTLGRPLRGWMCISIPSRIWRAARSNLRRVWAAR